MITKQLFINAARYSRDAYTVFEGPYIQQIVHENLSAYVIYTPGEIWIIFCGTDDLKDWVYSGDVRKVPNPYGDGYVHKGFLEAFQALRDEILQRVVSLRLVAPMRCQVIITGHSLGGAMANVCAARLSKMNPILITFGSPKVFSGYTPSPCYVRRRFVNSGDGVTQIPIRFDHGGREVWFNQDGLLMKPGFFTRLKGIGWSMWKYWSKAESLLLENHDINEYIKNCERVSEQRLVEHGVMYG